VGISERSDDYKSILREVSRCCQEQQIIRKFYWGDPDDDELQEKIMKWRRASCFGNVHRDSFEIWWKKFKQLPDEESTIEELSPHIDEIIENANSSLKGKNPSHQQTRHYANISNILIFHTSI